MQGKNHSRLSPLPRASLPQAMAQGRWGSASPWIHLGTPNCAQTGELWPPPSPCSCTHLAALGSSGFCHPSTLPLPSQGSQALEAPGVPRLFIVELQEILWQGAGIHPPPPHSQSRLCGDSRDPVCHPSRSGQPSGAGQGQGGPKPNSVPILGVLGAHEGDGTGDPDETCGDLKMTWGWRCPGGLWGPT